MLLDQVSLLTAIGFSGAALMLTLFVSWLGARPDTYLLSWAAGLALVVVGVILFGLIGDHYDPAIQFASFAFLLSGFAFIYAGARQFRAGKCSVPRIFAIWAGLTALTSLAFGVGWSGLGTIIANFGIAILLVLAAFEYWTARAEAPLPMVGNTILYSFTALSFVLCGVALMIDGQMSLQVRPSNWAEDLNSIVAIAALTGIGALSLTLNQSRAARHHRRESMTDPLTGLINRRALFEAYAGKRIEPGVAVVMFDLDHFKAINDQLGHPVGDKVLQHFAQIVRDNIRVADAAARLGGEEFCLVLRDLSSRSAAAVAERIRASFAQTPTPLEDSSVSATVSAGIAISAESGESFETLMNRADDALYQAKSAGRNRVFPPGLRLVA